MPNRSTVLPHPLLSLTLLLMWLLLNNSAEPGHLLLGSLFGLLLPLFTRRFWPERVGLRRPGLALGLVLKVLWDILVANFSVARVVLGPADRLRPVFVQVPLEVKSDFAITTLASVVSLTPGTVSADLAPDRRHLLVHALSEDQPEELVRTIKARYEAPIREIFSC